jgi:hypothetical protein
MRGGFITIDVAARRAASRSFVEDGLGIPRSGTEHLDPEKFRIRSVTDGQGYTFVVMHEIVSGNVTVIAFDESGLPVQRRTPGSGPSGDLKAVVPADLGADSDLVLVPAREGFFLVGQQQSGSLGIWQLDTREMEESPGTPVPFTSLPGVELDSLGTSATAALGNMLLVATGPGTVTLVKASDKSPAGLQTFAEKVSFAGTPALAIEEDGVLAMIRTAGRTSVVKWTDGEQWKENATNHSPIADVAGAPSVVTATGHSSPVPAFLVSDGGVTAVIRVNDGEVPSRVPMTSGPIASPVLLLAETTTALIVSPGSAPGSLAQTVVSVGGEQRVDLSVAETSRCIQQTGDALGGSAERLGLSALRAARPLVSGPYLYLSSPYGLTDCVLDIRRPSDGSAPCSAVSYGRIPKQSAPLVALDALRRIALESARQEQEPSPSTTVSPTQTTVPVESAENPEPPVQKIDPQCEKVTEAPVPPRVMTPDDGTLAVTQASGTANIAVVVRWSGGGLSCRPNRFVAFSCVVSEDKSSCNDQRSTTFVPPTTPVLDMVIEDLPAKAGRRNRVWVLAYLNGTPSIPSNTYEIDVPVSAPCAPEGVKAKQSPTGLSWLVSWDGEAGRSCKESTPAGYEVNLVDCGGYPVSNLRSIRVDNGSQSEISVAAVGDPNLESYVNLRGSKVAFSVKAFSVDSDKKVYSRASAPTDCQETTTKSVDATLEKLGLEVTPSKKERKLLLKGSLQGGGMQHRALVQTLGTSSYDEVCMSWILNSKVVGGERCLAAAATKEAVSLEFAGITCVTGRWQLNIAPRGPQIKSTSHESQTTVPVNCDQAFSGSSNVAVVLADPTKSGGQPVADAWRLEATVENLGYDIDDYGPDLAVRASMDCDLWAAGMTTLGQDYLTVNPGDITPNPDGSAKVVLRGKKAPAVPRPATSCFVTVTTERPDRNGVSTVSATSTVDLSGIKVQVADAVAETVASVVAGKPNSGTFSRTFESAQSVFSHVYTMRSAVSCQESVFEVYLVAGSQSPVRCGASAADLSWTVASRGASDAAMTVPTELAVELSVKVRDTGAGSAELGSETRQLAPVTCLREVTAGGPERNWCADPRRPVIFSTSVVGLNLTVLGDFTGITDSLFEVRLVLGNGSSTSSGTGESSRQFDLSGRTSGQAWLVIGLKSSPGTAIAESETFMVQLPESPTTTTPTSPQPTG